MKLKYLRNLKLLIKLFTALIIGINSGLVYTFLLITTTAYFKDLSMSLTFIGLLSIKTAPYSFKYFWSPILDNCKLPFFPKNFGQRKTWMLSSQIILILLIASFGFINIKSNVCLGVILLLFIAFIGATYDIALEAYRIELFSKKTAATGNGFVIYGFRLGFIISGIFGLYLSTLIAWKYVFIILSAFILPCCIVVFFSKDKKVLSNQNQKNYKEWLKSYFISPIQEILKIKKVLLILMIIAFYKVGDA